MRTVAERTGKNEENGSWKPRCRVEVGEAKLPQKAERNLNTAVKKSQRREGDLKMQKRLGETNEENPCEVGGGEAR